jgi:hypothetical protein
MKSFDAIQAAITSGQINNNDHLPKAMMRFINTCLHMDASKRPSEEELLAAKSVLSSNPSDKLGEAVQRIMPSP